MLVIASSLGIVATLVEIFGSLVQGNKISSLFAVSFVKSKSNSLGKVHSSSRRVGNLTKLDHKKFEVARCEEVEPNQLTFLSDIK